MNPEEQRIAIAEACGWVRGHTGNMYWVNDPDGLRRGWSLFRGVADNSLPDYLNDLNAMHAAETKLAAGKVLSAYIGNLAQVLCNKPNPSVLDMQLWHATAAQRAEAFLRTLNLWKEDV